MTIQDTAAAFARRLRANAGHAERSKYTVCNLSTMKIEDARALADFIDTALADYERRNATAMFAAGIEAAARFVEDHQLAHTSGGDVIEPRTEGNRYGLGYATGLRTLAPPR